MRTFKRVHHTGSEAVTEHADGWRIQINLREPGRNPMTMTGYLAPTIESAKAVADKEIAKYGHVCNEACMGWIQTQ
jgi:hypothetical protein